MRSSPRAGQAPSASRGPDWNQQVTAKPREAADLLALQGANPFRVNAFRRAAATVAQLPCDIREVAEAEGPAGPVDLPNVGRGIAAAIIEIVATGRWSRLDRLRGELDAGRLFQSVPGIGPALAARIHDHQEYQCTVVTEFRGPLRGKRVVRGRERECRDIYSQ